MHSIPKRQDNPIPLEAARYRQRHKIENSFARLNPLC